MARGPVVFWASGFPRFPLNSYKRNWPTSAALRNPISVSRRVYFWRLGPLLLLSLISGRALSRFFGVVAPHPDDFPRLCSLPLSGRFGLCSGIEGAFGVVRPAQNEAGRKGSAPRPLGFFPR